MKKDISYTYYPIFSITVSVGVAVIIFFVGCFPFTEGVNRYSPWSGTEIAEGFSEEKFDMIRIGFDTLEVKNLIGEPISIHQNDSIPFIWQYTSKRKHEYGDFAWIARKLHIDKSGKVKHVLKKIYYY